MREDYIDLRRRKHHIVVDTGELLDLKGDRHIGIDKGTELVRYDAAHDFHCANLYDPVFLRAEAGCLNIKYHEGVMLAILKVSKGDRVTENNFF